MYTPCAMAAADPIFRLEHDHSHLGRLVQDLRAMAPRIVGADVDARDIRDEFTSILQGLADDLFDHFAREEEGLFPYIVERFSELRGSIAALEQSHDRICGAASRLLSLLHRGARTDDERSLVGSLFARFDAQYGEHARAESELLRMLAPRLSPAQRDELAELLRHL